MCDVTVFAIPVAADLAHDPPGVVPVRLESAAWLTAITVTSWALDLPRYRARVWRGMRRRTSRNPGILTP